LLGSAPLETGRCGGQAGGAALPTAPLPVMPARAPAAAAPVKVRVTPAASVWLTVTPSLALICTPPAVSIVTPGPAPLPAVATAAAGWSGIRSTTKLLGYEVHGDDVTPWLTVPWYDGWPGALTKRATPPSGPSAPACRAARHGELSVVYGPEPHSTPLAVAAALHTQ
jgi:hypothetical protein